MTTKIAMLGDSVFWTATTRAPHPVGQYLEMYLGRGYVVGTQAVSGYTASQVNTLYTSYVQGKGYDIVIGLYGINDFRVGVGNATVYPIFKGIVDAVLAEGKRYIGFNCLQMKNYAGAWNQDNEDERQLFNAAMAAYLTGRAGCTFVDASTQFESAGDPYKLAASLQAGDDLHPNTAGTQLLATLAQAAVLAG